jgi:flagella basal body P-ring formation protein FlgA
VIRALIISVAMLGASAASAAQPVTLKAGPVDTDGRITLRDLFDGAVSDALVAPGPVTGGTVVLDAARVQAAARAAGLAWANPAGVRRIIIRSASTASAPAPASAVAAQQGAAEALTYVRSLAAGAVVTAEDLAWTPVPRAPTDGPTDADQAIGLQLKKPVRAGATVSARDLTAAQVIAKNDTVTVQYRAGSVRLALQGKALSSAGVGDPVRILNPASKTVVEAVAAGPGLALVGPQAAALKSQGSAALASR